MTCPDFGRERAIGARSGALAGVVSTIATIVVLSAAAAPLRAVVVAQTRTPGANTPAFDVASVKANKSHAGTRGATVQPGGLAVTDLTVREIVAFAYGIPNPQRYTSIVGGPQWLDSDRFDILAKAEGRPSTDRIRLMLRALLADRFRLLIHDTTATLPIYALTKARRDGSLGPRRAGRQTSIVRRPSHAASLHRFHEIQRTFPFVSSGLSPASSWPGPARLSI
jgi:hypothetical protein